MPNADDQIPHEWKRRVRKILLHGQKSDILVTQRAREDWAAFFPNDWDYQRNEAIAEALNAPRVGGNRITTMREEGETWEFCITYSKRRLYVKINLLPSGKVILIYSIHPPRKGDIL